jgi:hypothetical protein
MNAARFMIFFANLLAFLTSARFKRESMTGLNPLDSAETTNGQFNRAFLANFEP